MGTVDSSSALSFVERTLQRRQSVIGLNRWRRDGRGDLEAGGAGRGGERTDTSGAYVSQRPSRRALHHPAHVMMTQLRLEMGQGMRVALEARMDHVRMRKSRVHRVHVGHLEAHARVQAALDAARRRVVVVLPLAVVVPRRRLRPRRRRLGGLRGRRGLAVRVLPAHVLRVRQLVVLLPLHPTVLEPDLYLPLGEDQRVRDLDPSPTRQVPVVMELLLQLEDLVPRVRGPLPLRLHPWLVRAVRCKNQREECVSRLSARDRRDEAGDDWGWRHAEDRVNCEQTSFNHSRYPTFRSSPFKTSNPTVVATLEEI